MATLRLRETWSARSFDLLCVLFLAVAAPTTAWSADRLVLVEEFTATWCGYCSYAGPALDQLMDNYPDGVLTLEMHQSDAYSVPWGDITRPNFYSVGGIPNVWFDGVVEHSGVYTNVKTNYNWYEGTLLDRLNVPTDVSIEMSAVQTDGNSYDVTTSISLEEDGTATSMRLSLVSALDHWPTSPSYSRNTLRQAVETGFDITLNPGESTEFTRSITLDGTDLARIEDVKMIAAAQAPRSNGPAEIFNAAQLYLFAPIPGDFNGDGAVDGNDFVAWQVGFGDFPNGGATVEDGDANGDGYVDGDDFLSWQANYGDSAGSSAANVPEPGTVGLTMLAMAAVLLRRRVAFTLRVK